MPPRAQFTTRVAWLGTEFGERFARQQFGDAVVDALPRKTRGKNAGKHTASIEWKKCESGGWVSYGAAGHGYVEHRRGQVLCSRLIIVPWGGGQPQVLHEKTDPQGRLNFELGAW